jgi:hypothetical protein
MSEKKLQLAETPAIPGNTDLFKGYWSLPFTMPRGQSRWGGFYGLDS